MTIRIKVELGCDWDTGRKIQDLIDNLLQKNIEPKYKMLKWAKTTIYQV